MSAEPGRHTMFCTRGWPLEEDPLLLHALADRNGRRRTATARVRRLRLLLGAERDGQRRRDLRQARRTAPGPRPATPSSGASCARTAPSAGAAGRSSRGATRRASSRRQGTRRRRWPGPGAVVSRAKTTRARGHGVACEAAGVGVISPLRRLSPPTTRACWRARGSPTSTKRPWHDRCR